MKFAISCTFATAGLLLAGALGSDSCEQHEIDFVLVEGDAIRTSIESEIVNMLAEVGITVKTRALSKEELKQDSSP